MQDNGFRRDTERNLPISLWSHGIRIRALFLILDANVKVGKTSCRSMCFHKLLNGFNLCCIRAFGGNFNGGLIPNASQFSVRWLLIKLPFQMFIHQSLSCDFECKLNHLMNENVIYFYVNGSFGWHINTLDSQAKYAHCTHTHQLQQQSANKT